MKISKSKQELARIISENGGWREGAEFAVQGQETKIVGFSKSMPYRRGCGWFIKGEMPVADFKAGHVITNWHQTILSREEYFHLYPAPDADGWIEWKGGECPVQLGTLVDVKYANGITNIGVSALTTKAHEGHVSGSAGSLLATNWSYDLPMSGIIAYRLHKPEQSKPEFCESVMRSIPEPEAKQTIEQLVADYRNKLDYAERKQQEADAAKSDAEAKLAALVAAGTALGLVLSTATTEPELVITDWRDLQVGDEVDASYRGIERVVGSVLKIDASDSNQPIFVSDGAKGVWATEFKFIRRP